MASLLRSWPGDTSLEDPLQTVLSYHYHRITHLAQKFKTAPTGHRGHRKITAPPSQAATWVCAQETQKARPFLPGGAKGRTRRDSCGLQKVSQLFPRPLQSTKPGSDKTNSPLRPQMLSQLASPGGFQSPTQHVSWGRHPVQSVVSSKIIPGTLRGWGVCAGNKNKQAPHLLEQY